VSGDILPERPGDDPEDRRTSRSGPEVWSDRPELVALIRWGFPRVTLKQRQLLDEIAERHDRTSIAGIIAATPPWPEDPLETLMAWDRDDRSAVHRRLDHEDRERAEAKAADRADAARLVPHLAKVN
jgi:hypothetical protein